MDNEELPNHADGSRGPIIFIDKTGQNAFAKEFLSVNSVIEGRFTNVILLNGYSAFIDRKTGKNVFDMEFRGVSHFNQHGFAEVVLLDGTFRYIDRSGNFFYPTYGDMSTGLFFNEEYFIIPVPVTAADALLPDATPTPHDASNPPDTQISNDAPNQPDALTLRFTVGSTSFSHNGTTHQVETAPFISQGRTMIPLRIIAESLGAEVGWDGTTRTVSITRYGEIITLVVDVPLPDEMGTPVIVNGFTFVPVRYVSETLGANVRWDGANPAVYIYGK